jgi:pentose-5-phosphate-3-epimerase
MIEIIPAILPKSFAELEETLGRLKGVAPLVQIDLVGSTILAGEEALPLWEEFDFEFDLMVEDSRAAVESLVALGASRVVVHAGRPQAHEALQALQEFRDGDFPVALGLALQAHDEPQVLEGFTGLYDYVQVMGIDHEGSQGQPPDPHHKDIGLVRALRAARPELIIQVDGAVGGRVQEFAAAGANRLVVGSAIVRAEDPRAEYKRLYNLVNGS